MARMQPDQGDLARMEERRRSAWKEEVWSGMSMTESVTKCDHQRRQ